LWGVTCHTHINYKVELYILNVLNFTFLQRQWEERENIMKCMAEAFPVFLLNSFISMNPNLTCFCRSQVCVPKLFHILKKKYCSYFAFLIYALVMIKVKVKIKMSLCWTKHHAMKTYWGRRSIVPYILDLGTR
jgi:hypothetical protein